MEHDIEYVLRNAPWGLSIRDIEKALKAIGYPSIELYDSIYYYLNNGQLALRVSKTTNHPGPQTYKLL